ncbi:hypothetical protein F5X98DRAFT_335120 [Xylaria grammica]|nr:hypothetical protein F5X98DRAFT_335120 [Xylaria grammica]
MAGLDLEIGLNITQQLEAVKKIEDYKPGYPRFAALIAANPDFSILRQFRRLRTRALLLQQDKITVLEERLDHLDQAETSPLFLGQSRSDQNPTRRNIIDESIRELANYDSLLQGTHKILAIDSALPRDVLSLQHWVNGTGCLCRKETEYLDHKSELISLAPSSDRAAKRLEDWVEDSLVRRFKPFKKVPNRNGSTNSNVYLYSGPLIKRTAQAIMLIIITFLLLLPVILCLMISGIWGRICVITTSTIIYLFVLSLLTRSKMMELIVAGATFATILTVFISS